jgi:HD-GYP domain-containing protein (c-di-GMP phosphodiesterase class II)
MPVPELRYDLGELHNLTVERGTLTIEERFKVQEHAVQTIAMLGQLPFPRHLQHVPEIAGGHHERVDGRGYPRGLTGDQMSPLARMLAIADVFEALTASDRPYKPAASLSQAIGVLAAMRDDGHVDPDLFELFLTSGAFRRYADGYLRPDQLDDVDVTRYLSGSGS